MFDKMQLSDYAVSFVERCVQDDLEVIYNTVFFFGQIFEDNPYAEGDYDEFQYACCPVCGELIKVLSPKNYDDVSCPKCGQEGTLFDFHDEELDLDNYLITKVAYLEAIDDGYVLRLFNTGLLFSERDFDDYRHLSYYPEMYVHEIGREYWYKGKVECYKNEASYWDVEEFFYCDGEELDDDEFVIVNFEEEKFLDPMVDSCYIADLIYYLSPVIKGISFMEALAQHLNYKTFHTLKKYDFNGLYEDYIYQCDGYPDSNKISQVLGVDYNQLIAYNDACIINYEDLENARKLAKYNLKFTSQNMQIISYLDDFILDNFDLKKTFKYIRNLMNRSKSKCIAKDYRDYISDCQKLDFDISSNEIRYPSKFEEKHVEYAMLVATEKNRLADERFDSMIKRFENVKTFQIENYIVRLAQSPAELKVEGQILHHCVGTYISRVCEGNCLIFFVRKLSEPDIPFYTLEYDFKRNKIVQCRGERNVDYHQNKDVQEAVYQWLNWIKSVKSSKQRVA